jgi:hypothetical protein
MKLKSLILLFGLINFSFLAYSQTEKDKLDIYTIFLNSFVSDMVVIRDSTVIAKDEVRIPYQEAVSKIPKLDEEGFKDLFEQNKQKTLLNFENHSQKKIVLLTHSSYEDIFGNNGGWYKYYKTFPKSNGLVRLSNFGFNKEGTQAVFFYAYLQEGRAGVGYLAIYEKINNQWVFEDREDIWVY